MYLYNYIYLYYICIPAQPYRLTFHGYDSSNIGRRTHIPVAKVFGREQDREHGTYCDADRLTRRVARGRVTEIVTIEHTKLTKL